MNRHFLSLGSALLILVLSLVAPMAFMAASADRVADTSFTRTLDPVVLTGAQMPDWAGVSLDHLFLYTYHASSGWRQIPWQFDEKHEGVYVANEDGKLDADDELAFMASDCGAQASPSQWITDADARSHRRYEIAVTDPLHPGEQCWVYLYRSTTLVKATPHDYVGYSGYIATGENYRLTMQKTNLIAESLKLLGSSTDVLDRTKVRVRSGSFTLTEAELTPADPRTDWYSIRDGDVRTITHFVAYDDETSQTYILVTLLGYPSMFHERVTYDLSSVASTLDEFRYSADLTPAMAGGTYYDANTPAGVPVDGHPDAVATTPFSPWNQVSHSILGSIVQVIDPSPLGGTLQTYYKDDSSYDSNDTGDHQSYADPGVLVTNGSANLVFDVWYYVLPAAQPNVGAAYADAATHPLQAQATAQERVEATATPTPTSTFTPSSTPTATATPTHLDFYLPLIQAE